LASLLFLMWRWVMDTGPYNELQELIRVARHENAETVAQQVIRNDTSGLPAIEMQSVIADRLRQLPGTGWRIVRRDVRKLSAMRPSGTLGRRLAGMCPERHTRGTGTACGPIRQISDRCRGTRCGKG
jgi:hypothetical protein